MMGGITQSLTGQKYACVPIIPAPNFRLPRNITYAKLVLTRLLDNSESGDQRREND